MNCVSCFFMRSRAAGFTLVEMMIVIAIAAILLATAAPSFQTMVIKSNVESLQDDFANAVITARTEAASRGQEVRVCAFNGNNHDCTSDDWTNGWVVVVDDVGEVPPVKVLASFPNEIGYPVTVHDEAGASKSEISFNSQGYNANETRYVFAACGPDAINPKVARGVTVERTGRAYHTNFFGAGHKHTYSFEDGDGGETQAADLKCSQG